MIEDMMNKEYDKTSDGMYIRKQEHGETWEVIGELFSAFVKTQKELDEITRKTTFDDVIKSIGINIDGFTCGFIG